MSSRLTMILILGAFVALGPLTIDMYLPALPALTVDLATTSSTVQLTLTGTLVGLALGQLLIGPLSDSLGRRRPLLAGIGLHVAASLAIIVAPNVVVLGALRVLQGAGAAAGMVIALAIIRDLYSGRAGATMFSRLMLVMGVAPVLAPTLGGELLRITSWRGVFVALAIYGVGVLTAAALVLRESLPPEQRRPAGIVATSRTYGRLLQDRVFVGLVLVAGLTMAGLFGYVAGSSFVLQQQFGLDQQQFGLTFGAGAVFLIAATQLNAYLLRAFEPGTLLLAALLGGSVAGLVLVATTLTGVGGIVGVLVPMFGVLFAVGLALPNAPALALAGYGDAAGTAAALLGAVQFGVGALVSRWSACSATAPPPWVRSSPVGSSSDWPYWSSSCGRGASTEPTRPGPPRPARPSPPSRCADPYRRLGCGAGAALRSGSRRSARSPSARRARSAWVVHETGPSSGARRSRPRGGPHRGGTRHAARVAVPHRTPPRRTSPPQVGRWYPPRRVGAGPEDAVGVVEGRSRAEQVPGGRPTEPASQHHRYLSVPARRLDPAAAGEA